MALGLPAALLPVGGLLLALLAGGAHAGDYCDTAFVWLPDGTRPQQADWSSYAATTGFGAGPCLKVSGIGATITQDSTLLVIDRSGATNTYATVGGDPGAPLAYAEEVDLRTGAQRGLDVITNTFCSTGAFNPNGTFLSIGGDYPGGGGDPIAAGIGSVRAFTPCADASCTFSIQDSLGQGRWYPSAQLLADGRVAVVGGATGGVGLNSDATNVPSIEYIPKDAAGPRRLDFLAETLPYNLFPFVHLLPSGKLFIFAGDAYILYDTQTDTVAPGDFPSLEQYNADGKRIFRQYPLSGTSALLPLGPAAGHAAAEVMICGGASTASNSADGQDPNALADDMCYRINPEADNPQWVAFQMASPRVMPVAVLLPDRHVLIVSGAQSGWAGLGTTCHNAVLTPEMWNSYTQRWYQGPALATSKIPRVYHSSALLNFDASVLITGSNPNTEIKINGGDFPTELRGEYFYPPYMQNGQARPVVTRAPGSVQIGTEFTLDMQFDTADAVAVVLVHPGFSTHSSNHGQRMVILDVKAVVNRGQGLWTIRAVAPPDYNTAPPTWYWLFVLENGMPNTEGQVVFVV